jgi:hypothetical protein
MRKGPHPMTIDTTYVHSYTIYHGHVNLPPLIHSYVTPCCACTVASVAATAARSTSVQHLKQNEADGHFLSLVSSVFLQFFTFALKGTPITNPCIDPI